MTSRAKNQNARASWIEVLQPALILNYEVTTHYSHLVYPRHHTNSTIDRRQPHWQSEHSLPPHARRVPPIQNRNNTQRHSTQTTTKHARGICLDREGQYTNLKQRLLRAVLHPAQKRQNSERPWLLRTADQQHKLGAVRGVVKWSERGGRSGHVCGERETRSGQLRQRMQHHRSQFCATSTGSAGDVCC